MTTPLTVLVVGSGGREHALALAIDDDPAVAVVHVAPGNPGTAAFATNHPVDVTDAESVTALARTVAADLVVIGPEAPLVAGVADAVRDAGIACFGPSAEAARLEASKAFAKEVMQAAGVPTGEARLCRTSAEVSAALDAFGMPFVVKDDGLAAGKGVLVCEDRSAAMEHAESCGPVVIEEFLDGPEVSLFAITDGTVVRPLQPAQDFKRMGDQDTGPNTGGMGSYTPLPWAPEGLVDEVVATVLQPTVDEMARRGTPFAGLLYAGLALTSRGVRVIEFNARFGDPETQPLLSLLESPLAQVLLAAATGRLADVPALQWKAESAVAVVLGAEGYPGTPVRGGVIEGLGVDDAGSQVIHAGTALDSEGRLVSSGGRVLAVVGRGADLTAARRAAYERISRIRLAGSFHRNDIAERAAKSPVVGTQEA